jgi:hypothetical protein
MLFEAFVEGLARMCHIEKRMDSQPILFVGLWITSLS